jgi:predicted transcriptional regulator
MAKRERLRVIHDILAAVRDNRQIKPTRLLQVSNLSPQMFKEYIQELSTKRFIEETLDGGRKHYQLTDKGYSFLEQYKTMLKFIDDFGL